MADESAIDQAMTMIRQAIVDLNLSGIAASSTKIKEIPVATKEERAGGDLILISPWGAETDGTSLGRGNNANDEWTYPVMVAIVGNPDMKSLKKRLRIRRNIRRRFHRKAVSDFPAGSVTDGQLILTMTSPGNIVDVMAYLQESMFVSPIIVNVTVQESREQ